MAQAKPDNTRSPIPHASPDPAPRSGNHPFTKVLLRDLAMDVVFGGALVAFGVIAFVAVFVVAGGVR